jgi:hypothetical protein
MIVQNCAYTLADVPEDVPLDVDVVLGEVNALLHVIRLWHRVDVNQIDLNHTYTVKKLIDFPVPRRDVSDQTLPGRQKI